MQKKILNFFPEKLAILITRIQYLGLWNNFCYFDFFKKFLTIWKSSLSRSRKLESGVSKVNLWFKKNSWRSINGPKIAELFPWFLTTWFELWFQKWYHIIDTKFLLCAPLILQYFVTDAFYIENFVTYSLSPFIWWIKKIFKKKLKLQKLVQSPI